jgi:hypothetical protein
MAEYLTGKEAEEHAYAFANELESLMIKYGAELNVDITGDAYAHMFFDFNQCGNTVWVGSWTDGKDLEVR